MNLPTEIRYRPYDEWTEEDKENILKNVSKSPWRATYHLEAKTGLLNDPNGFSYFNGKFHLFYQNWPFGAAHGLKQWVHTESDDLVHFKETGIKLKPDHVNDSHGAYSGSALAIDDKLFLFYTGNVRDMKWNRDPRQIGAWMTSDGKITKFDKVLISQPNDVTEHFRDPQIFNYDNQFYAVIGAQNSKKCGFIKLYKALNNDIHHWEFVGDLDFGGTGSEYMIECPNIIFVKGKPVLLYSPQGLDKNELDYQNIYPNTYKIGQYLDANSSKIVEPSPIYNLDYGFEAYATQGFNTSDGRTFIVSWIGLPDIDYPSDQFDYQGAMSLVKELSIKNGNLYQYPVPAMKNLRQHQAEFKTQLQTNNTYELELLVPRNDLSSFVLFANPKGQGLSITIDTAKGKVIVDRSQAGQQYATEFGTSRQCDIPKDATSINIFIDKSIFEIFINKGEKVFTGRVFPDAEQSGIQLKEGHVHGKYFELKY